jgi:hypothetical protein
VGHWHMAAAAIRGSDAESAFCDSESENRKPPSSALGFRVTGTHPGRA